MTDESLRAALGKFQGEISQVCLRAFPRVGVRVVCVDVCVDVWVCVCERMYNRLASTLLMLWIQWSTLDRRGPTRSERDRDRDQTQMKTQRQQETC